VLSFLFWCDLDGVGTTTPSEAAIRHEFEKLGHPELAPNVQFWRDLERNPRLPWVLFPGFVDRRTRRRCLDLPP
jgi:hypothetical protein